MPVNQISGIHLEVPQFPALLTFTTAKDYTDLTTRYKLLPRAFDQTIEHMRTGMAAGLMPPKFLLEKVVTQSEGIAAMAPEKSPFAAPLDKFPKEIPEAEQKRLREQMLAAIQDSILPAYARFAKFVKEEYAPRGRTEPGMWSLPDGEARYAWRVKQSTTSDLTPEEIHQLGLREVARIEGEMLVIARKLGYSDLKSLNAAIDEGPQAARSFAPADPRPLQGVHRPDVRQAAAALRPPAQGQGPGGADRGVPREGGLGGRVPAGLARRLPTRAACR